MCACVCPFVRLYVCLCAFVRGCVCDFYVGICACACFAVCMHVVSVRCTFGFHNREIIATTKLFLWINVVVPFPQENYTAAEKKNENACARCVRHVSALVYNMHIQFSVR